MGIGHEIGSVTGVPPPSGITVGTLRQNPTTSQPERWTGSTWVSADIWVDETGDTMTGDLDMSGNNIENAHIDSGTF